MAARTAIAKMALPALAVAALTVGGVAGWWLAGRIGAPAIADDADRLIFTELCAIGAFGMAWLALQLRHLPAAIASLRTGCGLPVLMQAMRAQMRQKRTPYLLLVPTAVLSLLAIVIVSLSNAHGLPITMFPELGRMLFRWLMALAGLLVLLLTPALTAGAFAREREQHTLDGLLLTRQSPAQLVWGKLLAGLAFLGLVLFCGLPVLALVFILGGVAVWQVLAAAGMLIVFALCFGAIGLWCSLQFRSTPVAVTVAYVVCAVLVLVTPLYTCFFDFKQFNKFESSSYAESALILLNCLVIPACLLIFIVMAQRSSSLYNECIQSAIIACPIFIILQVVMLCYDTASFGSPALYYQVVAISIPLSLPFIFFFAIWRYRRLISAKLKFALICTTAAAFVIALITAALIGACALNELQDGYEYIKYLDPVMAFAIVLTGDYINYSDFTWTQYCDLYGDLACDWPSIFSIALSALLITAAMLGLAIRRLRRMRQ